MSDVGGVSSAQLKSFIERIERLEEEKAAIGGSILKMVIINTVPHTKKQQFTYLCTTAGCVSSC